jgi:hypothetical protein
MKETDKRLKQLAEQVGGLIDSMGKFAEHQVRPKILELFRTWGIDLKETVQGVTLEKDGKLIAQIDLLLANSIYSVIVEVKHTLRQKDVDEHLERLQKIQTFPNRFTKGTSMYGAVAGMTWKKKWPITPPARACLC